MFLLVLILCVAPPRKLSFSVIKFFWFLTLVKVFHHTFSVLQAFLILLLVKVYWWEGLFLYDYERFLLFLYYSLSRYLFPSGLFQLDSFCFFHQFKSHLSKSYKNGATLEKGVLIKNEFLEKVCSGYDSIDANLIKKKRVNYTANMGQLGGYIGRDWSIRLHLKLKFILMNQFRVSGKSWNWTFLVMRHI